MIILLENFIGCWANKPNPFPSTGVLNNDSNFNVMSDSAKISYDDLRLVNVKLVELNYTKQQLDNYKQICHNDSIVLNACQSEKDIIYKKYKTQKVLTTTFGVGFGVAILSTMLIFIFK